MAGASNEKRSSGYDEVLKKGIIGVRDWRPFVRTVLKLTKDEIELAEKNHRDDFAEQRHEMVTKWKDRLNAEYSSGLSNDQPSPELLMQKMHQYHCKDATHHHTPEQPTLPSPPKCSKFEIFLKSKAEKYKSVNLDVLKTVYGIQDKNFADLIELYRYVDEEKIWGDPSYQEKLAIVEENLRTLSTPTVAEGDDVESNLFEDVDGQNQDAQAPVPAYSDHVQAFLEGPTSNPTIQSDQSETDKEGHLIKGKTCSGGKSTKTDG